MCRLLTFLLCLGSFSPVFAQPSPTFDNFLASVISHNGGATLEGVAVAVTGSIRFPQPYAFSLIVQPCALRGRLAGRHHGRW